MALFLLQNLNAKTVVNTPNLIVQAESEADAKAMANTHFHGDSGWAGATATALTATTMDSDASMLGWTFKIQVSGGAGQTEADDPVEVSVTGAGTDDLDAVAAKLVLALNATTDIANAAYTAPNLTVASGAGGDDLGDAKVLLFVYPPSGETNVNLSALFVGAGGITDGGGATDALAIAFVADTEAAPKVLAAV